jgi:hypothetical protein
MTTTVFDDAKLISQIIERLTLIKTEHGVAGDFYFDLANICIAQNEPIPIYADHLGVDLMTQLATHDEGEAIISAAIYDLLKLIKPVYVVQALREAGKLKWVLVK